MRELGELLTSRLDKRECGEGPITTIVVEPKDDAVFEGEI